MVFIWTFGCHTEVEDVGGGGGSRKITDLLPLLVREKYNVGSNFGYHAVTSFIPLPFPAAAASPAIALLAWHQSVR